MPSRYQTHRGELHFEDKKNLSLKWVHITGGPNCLSLLNCPNFTLEHLILEKPDGPPDPSGHCLLLDKSWGSVNQVSVIASPQSEDLISVFSDIPLGGLVTLTNILATGRGLSNSSTSICLDGPYCPLTQISFSTLIKARCGVQIAGGQNHWLEKTLRFKNCQTNWNSFNYNPHGNAPCGPFRIECGPEGG